MLKQLFKIIWGQRRTNGWIFGEILIVTGLLWVIMDSLVLEYRMSGMPLGFDIENTYLLKLAVMGENSPSYVPVESITQTPAEELLTLMDRIRRNEEVEEVCASYLSYPYGWGNSESSIEPLGVDSSKFMNRIFEQKNVTPEFFSVFRIKDKEGKDIYPQLDLSRPLMVISEDLEKEFYENGSGKGRYIKKHSSEQDFLIGAVTQPIRQLDHLKSEPCFFHILHGPSLDGYVSSVSTTGMELCIRMKRHKTVDEMNEFLISMGDQLTVNNLYVTGSLPLSVQRNDRLKEHERESKIYMILVVFLLINVLFGIIGTFWLRTQNRKNEIGLRVAVGSTRQGIYNFLTMEGICLLMITLPIILFFAANVIYFDHLDSYRLPLTAGRMMFSFAGTYLLIAGMICLGISFPAWKATKLPPAEALHYE